MYGHEWKAIKGTEKILPDYIMKKEKGGGGGGISNLLPQCSMTLPHTALQDSILRLPTMSKCLGTNKNQLTSSIFDLNIIKKHRNFVEKCDVSLKENKTKTNAKDRQQRQG